MTSPTEMPPSDQPAAESQAADRVGALWSQCPVSQQLPQEADSADPAGSGEAPGCFDPLVWGVSQTADAPVAALAPALSETASPARLVGRTECGWQWYRRHPIRAGLTVVGLLLLAAGTGLALRLALLWFIAEEEQKRKALEDKENALKQLKAANADKDKALEWLREETQKALRQYHTAGYAPGSAKPRNAGALSMWWERTRPWWAALWTCAAGSGITSITSAAVNQALSRATQTGFTVWCSARTANGSPAPAMTRR